MALAHIGRNSGSFGSNPIRLIWPPSASSICSLASLSASQSLVSMSSGVRPASSTTELFTRMTRLSKNSGIP